MDPDQMASLESSSSGSIVFSKKDKAWFSTIRVNTLTATKMLLIMSSTNIQGSKIAPIHSCLQVPQAAGQVKILKFLVIFSPIYANNFCDAGQVLIFKICRA